MSVITNDDLIPMVRTATHEVFGTMMGLTLEDGEARTEHSATESSEGVLALIGLAGDWVGTGTFSCNSEMARKLAGCFLMTEFSSIDEEVLDAMGELSNMIFGNVKTMLEDRLGPMGLSIPTVVMGRNFSTRSIGKSEWLVVPFTEEGRRFEVRICMVRSTKQPPSHRLTSALMMVD